MAVEAALFSAGSALDATEAAEATRLSIFKDLRFRSTHEPQITPTKLDLIGLRNLEKKDIDRVIKIIQK